MEKKDEKKEYGFWRFVNEHPIATFFIADSIVCGIVTIARIFKGAE